jgi:hypothetical protein
VVELTPEREYLLVTEFFADAVELGEAEVTDQVIDDGLQVIRKLWEAGLAHRDIKPPNLTCPDPTRTQEQNIGNHLPGSGATRSQKRSFCDALPEGR